MPKEKDLKKLVRARMAKTGESYSIAKLRLAGVTKPRRSAARFSSASADASAAPALYRVKITLSDVTPSIWRRVILAADTSLAQLHHIIQAAFGWWDYHLHQYIVDDQYFGVPNPEYADELPPMRDERDATLHSIAGAKEIVYEYDFGDSWRHVIEIEGAALAPDAGVRYPICTGGARSRPPEDCGGPYGYEELLQVLADPKHEEHSSMKRWVGKKFDPESFDLAAVNRVLQKVGNGSGRRTRRSASPIASFH